MPKREEQQVCDFLDEQLREARHKITRLEHAKRTSDDCAEAAGLDMMLRSAVAERRVIEDLIARRSDGAATTGLSAQIMARINRLRTRAADAVPRWRRGHPTPSAYWEAAETRAILEQLLRRWNAWRAGRPYYPPIANGAAHATAHGAPPPSVTLRANPWSIPPRLAADSAQTASTTEDTEKLLERNEARRDELLAVLARAGIAPDHIDIVFASEHMAIVTAFAHSDAERRVIINTIVGSDEIDTVLADIRVVDPGRCPVCRARRRQDGTAPDS